MTYSKLRLPTNKGKDINVGASTDATSQTCKKMPQSLQKNPAAWMLHGVTLHNVRCRLYAGVCN